MKYFYSAKNYEGKTKSGELEARDERDLAIQLRSEGFILTSSHAIESDDGNKINSKIFDRIFGVALKDRMMFTRNLSVMIGSGLPLSKAIYNLSSQTSNKRFTKILLHIFDDIQEGSTFADALAKYPAVFNELSVSMVKVGETSGNLEEVLLILADQLEKEHDLISKVRGAMTYPAVILFAMFGIGIIMMTYVMPKLLGVFKSMKVELPWTTQLVIKISDTLRNYSLIVLIVFVIVAFAIKFFLSTENGKRAKSYISIHLPGIKNMIIKINCARFARIYSSLLKSGVSVVESLKIVRNTLGNYYFRSILNSGIEQIQKGIPLSKVLEEHSNIFPILVGQMVAVGEETGKTEVVLLKLAEFYEKEVDQQTKNLSSIIEPMLMVIIGSAVGFFAISMLQPMYSIMDTVK